MHHKRFIEDFTIWVQDHDLINGASILGSYARGEQKLESDIDLLIVSDNLDHFIKNTEWVIKFGKNEKVLIEYYGELTSVRCFYNTGLEIEFGFVNLSWTSIPIDQGTYNVVKNGFKILYDPLKLLSKLNNEINKG
tara:strand:+ start:151 stop:558 length:408 start_codon:yes stop_codon:yes gene_type:complete